MAQLAYFLKIKGFKPHWIIMLSLALIYSITNHATATSRYSIVFEIQRALTVAITSNQ
jgi:hypothetical protein